MIGDFLYNMSNNMGTTSSRGCLQPSPSEAYERQSAPAAIHRSAESLPSRAGSVTCVSACSSSLRHFFRAAGRQPNSEERELLSLGQRTSDTSPSRATIDSLPDNTPFLLHNAVVRKDVNMIRKLVNSNPACCTELNLSGESALHIACKMGDIEIVDEMLNLGCDPNICTGVGIPVHSVLQGMKQGQITEELGINLVQLFLRKGCDLTMSNAEDQNSKTVLLCAAEYGSPLCMDILIQAGASVNTMDHNCFSPLYMSTIRGDLACVKLLLQHRDINVNIQDRSGRTPLIAGLITIISSLTYDRLHNDLYNTDCIPDEMIILNRNNRIAIVEALLRAGADPNKLDNHGRNALGLAFLVLELEAERYGYRGDIDSMQNHATVTRPSGDEESVWQPNEFVSRYTLLVRLLVLYGAVFPSHINLEYFSKAPAEIVNLYSDVEHIIVNRLVQTPAKLTQACRMKIRSHLADKKNLDKITHLPLPHRLKNYLQFEYF